MFNSTPRQTSRDIWSHGNAEQLRDLISSALSTLLLLGKENKPAYFASPWISDFVLFDNRFRQYEILFPEIADNSDIWFSDYLLNLSRNIPVRLVTTRTPTSQVFLKKISVFRTYQVEWRFAREKFHEKGILAPSFYIEGSMNITYSGLNINGEKITYYTSLGKTGANKIASAYLELDRHWENLGDSNDI